jgi:hypothetical protein
MKAGAAACVGLGVRTTTRCGVRRRRVLLMLGLKIRKRFYSI